MNDWLVAAIALAVGAVVCRLVAARVLRDPPEELVRTNVDGRAVPAVLGWAVVAGVVAGYIVWGISEYIDYGARLCDVRSGRACDLILVEFPWQPLLGFILLPVGMFSVGLWDDFKGDERPRGFAGHLSSLGQGRWTGGLVKLIGGSVISIAAVLLIDQLRSSLDALLVLAACAALNANLINLFDRAPGRALKVFLVVVIPLILFGDVGHAVFFAGTLGAIVVALPIDLNARAMLGDAGANPIGAILGLGVGLRFGSAYGNAGLYGVLIFLAALNVASEKWSFSEVIANNRVLDWLDHLGRE